MQRKEKIQGTVIVFCFVIIPILFLFLLFQKLEQGRETNNQYYAKKLKVKIENDSGAVFISAWKREEDHAYYLFLPSYAAVNNTHVILQKSEETLVYIGDKQWTEEMALDDFEKEVPYPIAFHNSEGEVIEQGSFTILKSKQLAAMHIDTRTGGSSYINGSKDAKEEGVISLITAAGTLDYEGQLSFLKGRGNATWEYPKKPYNLKLKQKENLLDLGMGDTFSLLANWSDSSFIRNKIAYDLGKGVGLQNTPNAEFVDLFLNGVYNGTYQLTQKVEAPSYLLEMEIFERFKEEPKGFLTEAGQAITVKAPENISYDEVDLLALKFQELEEAILAEDGVNKKTGRHYSQIMDVPSWVKVYLVQEVMQNYDAYVSSLFMYTEDVGKSPVFCGPIWDFDWTLIARDGTGENVLTANQSRHPFTNYWIPSLYEKEEFRQAVFKEYEEVFLPVVEEILKQNIPMYTEQLASSMQMNAGRWRNRSEEEWRESVSTVSDYLSRRTESLLEIWGHPEQFYKVHMECDSDSFGAMDYYIRPGETCQNFPEGLQKEGYQFSGWYEAQTDETFDVNTPIQGNLEVEARWIKTGSDLRFTKWLLTEVLQIRYLLGAVLVFGLLGMVICDAHRNKGKRDGQQHG